MDIPSDCASAWPSSIDAVTWRAVSLPQIDCRMATDGQQKRHPGTHDLSRSYLPEHFHPSVRSVHADSLPVLDELGRALDTDDGGQGVFTGDDRPVGHQAADLGHQA